MGRKPVLKEKRSLQINFTEPQAEFFKLECRYPLLNAGLGAGKSRTLANCAFIDATHSANAVIALYEPTYPLIRTILVPFMEQILIDHGITYTYNKNDHEIMTSSGGIGDFVFRSYENPDLLVGYESYRSHVDEIDVVNEEKARLAWRKIIARNRQWPQGLSKDHMIYNPARMRHEPNNRVSAYSTPEGYKFTYKTWGQNKLPDGTWKNPQYQYIKARSDSNPFLPEGYIESLIATYPAALREAYLEGEWRNMATGSVYNAYDRELHDSNEEIRPGESLYIGLDFNVRNMSATIWVKRNGGVTWHAVAELTGVLDTPEMCRIITERWKEKGHEIYVYPDASQPTNTTNASITDVALLSSAGFRIRAHKKNPFVRDRVSATNKAFSENRLYVNQRLCPTVADCLNQQAYDKNGEPDKDSGFDHQNDATTYPIAYEFPVRKPVLCLPVSWAM